MYALPSSYIPTKWRERREESEREEKMKEGEKWSAALEVNDSPISEERETLIQIHTNEWSSLISLFFSLFSSLISLFFSVFFSHLFTFFCSRRGRKLNWIVLVSVWLITHNSSESFCLFLNSLSLEMRENDYKNTPWFQTRLFGRKENNFGFQNWESRNDRE